MAARPADIEVPKRGGTEVVEIKGLPPLPDAAIHQVVSVSPRDAEPGENMSEHQSARKDIFLAPRVLDQSAFDELSGTLRSLIDDAHSVVDELGRRIGEARHQGATPSQASAQLQERLRLGARMLKAFQGQISRVEEGLATLRSHREDAEVVTQRLDDALLAFDAKVDELASNAERRAGKAAENVLRRLEEDLAGRDQSQEVAGDQIDRAVDSFAARVGEISEAELTGLESRIASRRQELEGLEAQIEERLESVRTRLAGIADAEMMRLEERITTRRDELARLDDRINESVKHADSLLKMVELAEQKSANLVHRQAAASVEIEAKSSEAKEIIRQCSEARKMLDETLLSAAEHIDEIDARSEEICARSEEIKEATREGLSSTEKASAELARHTAEAATLSQTLEHTASARLELRLLLEQLGPWQRLLLESDRAPDGTPKPVASMIEALRDGVSADLTGLSLAMRDLADRVERVVPTGAGAEVKGMVQVPERIAEDLAGADPTRKESDHEIAVLMGSEEPESGDVGNEIESEVTADVTFQTD